MFLERRNGLNTIEFYIEDEIGHLVFSRPPANAMTMEFFREFGELVTALQTRTDYQALIIRGSGRHFSSGAALDELLDLVTIDETGSEAMGQSLLTFLKSNRTYFQFIENCEVPTISMIRGVCLGSAFELALLSHFRFCSEDAIFGLPESSYGLMPGIDGVGKIAALAGRWRALDLVMRGTTFSASDALTMGIVDQIIPKKQLLEETIRFVKKITPMYRKEKRRLYLERIEADKS